jgi:hypothetical protein
MNAKKLAQLVSAGIMADLAKFLQTKRRFKTRLNLMSQKLILTASKSSEDNIVPEPTSTSRSFFKQQNPSEARAYL